MSSRSSTTVDPWKFDLRRSRIRFGSEVGIANVDLGLKLVLWSVVELNTYSVYYTVVMLYPSTNGISVACNYLVEFCVATR
jgi:hypothetical protein